MAAISAFVLFFAAGQAIAPVLNSAVSVLQDCGSWGTSKCLTDCLCAWLRLEAGTQVQSAPDRISAFSRLPLLFKCTAATIDGEDLRGALGRAPCVFCRS